MAQLIMHDCETDLKAAELAKRIIDFELNEEFLHNLNEKVMRDEIKDWGLCEDTKATLCEAG